MKIKTTLSSLLVAMSVAVVSGCATAKPDEGNVTTEVEAAQIQAGKNIYADKIDISYLSKMVIHPKDDWIGKQVFKLDNMCIEMVKELKIKKLKEPFKNLYRSAKLPKEVEIGEIETTSQIVDCSKYESAITILE